MIAYHHRVVVVIVDKPFSVIPDLQVGVWLELVLLELLNSYRVFLVVFWFVCGTDCDFSISLYPHHL